MCGETASRVRIVSPGAAGAKACAVVQSALAGGMARAQAWSVQPAWEWPMDRTEMTAASVFAPFADGGTQQGVGRLEVFLVLGQPAGAKEGDGLFDRAVGGGGGLDRRLQPLADGEECDGQVLEHGGDPRPEQGHEVSPGDGGGRLQGEVDQQLLVQTRAEATDTLADALQGEGAADARANRAARGARQRRGDRSLRMRGGRERHVGINCCRIGGGGLI